ncbi:hypothetical protein CORC01_03013 [Colletotrichum orchidophilum]|uniref:Uncharacterized protein n=1 Tax=Colletotrichum orchidophilum TaxID=1209926 RepID=A0A1G4BK55_9PEZI|nr:uncharacterized protein CORC01_03013 [Colletotrichum orchidophilum]OHF01822.1 hypothetical protein CORC01_03013 [Colletotrichum orchidophilum]
MPSSSGDVFGGRGDGQDEMPTREFTRFIVGFLRYTYVICLTLREGKGPMPFWMHSFCLAHDLNFTYIIGKAATQCGEHQYLRGTSTALLT